MSKAVDFFCEKFLLCNMYIFYWVEILKNILYISFQSNFLFSREEI